MNISISLGWNCHSSCHSVDMGWRPHKKDGYLTCPFDTCITNYENIINCIEDDFKYLTDSNNLQIIEAPWSTGGIIKCERLIYNNKYKFLFNHESPGHANLFRIQNWYGGINHFIDDNFALFKEKYNKRIQNFREYTSGKYIVRFVISRISSNTNLLNNTLKKCYPSLNFEIVHLPINTSPKVFNEHLHMIKLSEDSIKKEMDEKYDSCSDA